MEEGESSLNSSDGLRPEHSTDDGIEITQSILSKFSMKSFFGFTTKVESTKPADEDATLKAFRKLGSEPQLQLESNNKDQEARVQVPPVLLNCTGYANAEPESEKEGCPGKEQEGGFLLRQEPPPSSALSASRDDVLLVHGTLVHTTSDSESEAEGPEDKAGKNIDRTPPDSSILSDPSVDPKETSEESRKNESINEMGEMELSPEVTSVAPSELTSDLEPREDGFSTDLDARQDHPGEEDSPSMAWAVDKISFAGNGENASSKKEISGEKSFQLPAFFSGLRVLKKGATSEGGETITEIKPKDGDLALLKLTQPVQKSRGLPGTLSRKNGEKTPDPKATPTLLEQISQLLNIDMSKTEQKGENCEQSKEEEMGSDTDQESQCKTEEVSFQNEEVKPKSPETALEAFKALFMRPPKKGSTADTSELEAIKRKMRHEKESLRAVFERSKSRSGDGSSDSRSADQSPTEQDDRTPGRLQAVWPPPKTKDEEEKVGLKYTEAEYQAAILHLKREHKEEIENLQAQFELRVFRIRGEHAVITARLEETIENLKCELEHRLSGGCEKTRDACISTEDDYPPKIFRNVYIQTDRETFLKPSEDESKTIKSNQIVPKKTEYLLSKPHIFPK